MYVQVLQDELQFPKDKSHGGGCEELDLRAYVILEHRELGSYLISFSVSKATAMEPSFAYQGARDEEASVLLHDVSHCTTSSSVCLLTSVFLVTGLTYATSGIFVRSTKTDFLLVTFG